MAFLVFDDVSCGWCHTNLRNMRTEQRETDGEGNYRYDHNIAREQFDFQP
jgi:predicted DsbA family dithiol-disulfide isomerase